MANPTSRFSLICDELESAIRSRAARRALELVARLREVFAVAAYGRRCERCGEEMSG